jgi:chemotaxis protein CheC
MQFDEDQLDALTEAVNIGVGKAAGSLHTMLERRINLNVPSVRVCCVTEMRELLETPDQPLDTSVVQGFQGAITGGAMLAFPKNSGLALAKLMAEDELESDDLEMDLQCILEELGNIVLNGVLGSLANLFSDDFHYEVPELCNGSVTDALISSGSVINESEQTCLLADARFSVADSDVSGSLLLAFNTKELAVLLDRLLATNYA